MWGASRRAAGRRARRGRHRGACPARTRHPADLARDLVTGLRGRRRRVGRLVRRRPRPQRRHGRRGDPLPEPPDVELLIGSFDVPGARLLDVVAVMDRLRSPGGCPWDAEQTHASLVALPARGGPRGDRGHRERRPARTCRRSWATCCCRSPSRPAWPQEHATEPFDIDDVAGGLVDKLVRRHPHVFADVEAGDRRAVEANWEPIKAAEKQHRTHPLEGVPSSLPALARAEKYVSRLHRTGRDDLVDAAVAAGDVGAQLLDLVRRARVEGVDAEAALRETLRQLEQRSAATDGVGETCRPPEPWLALAPPGGADPPLRPGARPKGRARRNSAGGVPGAPGPRAGCTG